MKHPCTFFLGDTVLMDYPLVLVSEMQTCLQLLRAYYNIRTDYYCLHMLTLMALNLRNNLIDLRLKIPRSNLTYVFPSTASVFSAACSTQSSANMSTSLIVVSMAPVA